jgi:hypothetical protein
MDRLESIQNERAMWRKTVMTNVGLIKKLSEEIAKLKKQIVKNSKISWTYSLHVQETQILFLV